MDTISLEAWSEHLALAAKPFLGVGPELQVELRPLVDLAQGDITTDLAIRLAARCKINSEIVAQRVIDSLPKDYPGKCVQVRGYINIVVDPDRLVLAPLVKQPHFAPATVVFCPKQSSDLFSATRLFGLASLQTLVRRSLGGETDLLASNRPVSLNTDTFARSPTDFALLAPSSKEFLSAIGPEVLRQASGRQVFFWLVSDYASGAQFGRFIREHFAGHDDRILLSAPKELLLRRGNLGDDLELAPLDKQRLIALLFAFTCNVSGDEFDFDVSRLKEKGNIVWFLGSIAARLDSLLSEQGVGDGCVACLDSVDLKVSALDLSYRQLYLRSIMLPRFVIDSANGRVIDFITVLDDLLNRLSRLINTPEFRALVAKREISWSQQHILSGVARSLSGIIRLVSRCCELLE